MRIHSTKELNRLGGWALVCIALVVCPAACVRAQITTADVLGTVTDPSGAPIPNAKIVLRNTGTQEVRTARSNSLGEYTFTYLQSGRYSITASAQGFKSFALTEFLLSAGDRRREDILLSLGEVSQTVLVTSKPTPLNTDSSVLSTVVGPTQVEDLPLNGRNFVQLAQLSAGANEAQPGAIGNGNRPDDRRQTSSISVNAESDNLNNEMVDGLDNNEAVVGSIGVRPSIEAIAEFRVLTNLYPAEAGKTPGAVVNVITKSGTNGFHGSFYEFLRNDALNARDFFATVGPKPEYRQNQFGGSVGGPIRKDKTFFFADYEGLRIIQGRTHVSTVPTLSEQKNPGNLSDIGGPVLQPSQLNPIALKYFALYPAPNLPGIKNNFSYSPNLTQFSNTVDGRVDQQFSDKDRFFVRYTYNGVNTTTPSAFPAVNGIEPGGPASFPGPATDTADQVLLDETHIFTPTLLLELKAGYTRISNSSFPLNYGKNFGQQFGVVNANINQFTSALPNVAITGYSGFGDSTFLPIFDLDNIFQYSGSLSQTKGRHTFTYGAVLVRRQVYTLQNASGPGRFSFNTSPTGFALASFLEGLPFQVSRSVQPEPRYLRDWEPSIYFQDDWRVTNALTLNLGLRYDIITPFVDVRNELSNFNPTSASVIIAGVNGASRSAGVKTYYKPLGPRIGFAYSLRRSTVLRGGYGLVFFRDSIGPQNPFENPPFVTTYSPNPLSVGLSTPLPFPSPQSPTNLSGALSGMQLDYANSRVNQVNFNVEHSIGANVITVGYVGEFGRDLRISPNLDLAPPSPLPFATRRPFYSVLPNVTSILQIESSGFLNYNGLQTSFQRRLTRGWTVNANYTWSHAISDIQAFSQGGSYTSVIPSETATLERGNSDLDMRHSFHLMTSYELPFGRTLSGWEGTVAKGWQVNAIASYETGFPFSVANASPRSNTGIGSDRPDQIANPALSNPTVEKWFNTAAFQRQPLGTVGTEARNAVYGPPFRHLDLSLFKEFPLGERARLQFRAEAFNITNIPNFNPPSATLGTATFGTISGTRTGGTPRVIQFALRLTF